MVLVEVLLLVHPVLHLGDLALYLGQMMEGLAVGAHLEKEYMCSFLIETKSLQRYFNFNH